MKQLGCVLWFQYAHSCYGKFMRCHTTCCARVHLCSTGVVQEVFGEKSEGKLGLRRICNILVQT